jgi:hypothetical protein
MASCTLIKKSKDGYKKQRFKKCIITKYYFLSNPYQIDFFQIRKNENLRKNDLNLFETCSGFSESSFVFESSTLTGI